MAATEHYFVEWKEQYVSKERGNRVVHYFLKDNLGESILAVVGTERSVRHMFYVVSEEFLNAYGAETSVNAGFRWRSRREVVNWLTSMLSKQHRQLDCPPSPKDDTTSEINALQTQMAAHKGRLAKNLKGQQLDIGWSGLAWTCSKQLKHYPAFSRNGITIAVQSFVFVMAERENRYIAYVEDMYEDRKLQKKVKVRWFHHNREVKGVVSLRNPHPKEVFITPYVQVISAECVDGPAMVLTREHYEKCTAIFPNELLGRVHFCFRQFKNSRIKPFKLSKLRGYFDQSIFSCFNPDFFEDEEFSSEGDKTIGVKRTRSGREHQKTSCEFAYQKLQYGLPNKKLQQVEGHFWQASAFKVDEKIEVLCQDSGIRGCWFRCTVLDVSRRQMKIRYDDVKDEDSCGNLEEWIPTYRLARADKLGIRHPGRPTIRPAYPCDGRDLAIEVGAPIDAWWSDGWWEGVISGSSERENGSHQVYIPGENLYLNVERKNVRVSREWLGDRWVDIERNPNILSAISSLDSKISVSSAIAKETKSENSPASCHKALNTQKLSAVDEEIHDLGEGGPNNGLPKDESTGDEEQRGLEDERETSSDQANKNDDEDKHDDNVVDNTANHDSGEKKDNVDGNIKEDKLMQTEATEPKCEAEVMQVMT